MTNYSELFLIINGILLAILGFFAKSLIKRFDDTTSSLIQLDKSVSLLAEKLDNNRREMDHFDERINIIDREIISLRQSRHDIINEINKVVLRCDLTHNEKE